MADKKEFMRKLYKFRKQYPSSLDPSNSPHVNFGSRIRVLLGAEIAQIGLLTWVEGRERGLNGFFEHFEITMDWIFIFTFINIFIIYSTFDLYHFSKRSFLAHFEESKHIKGYNREEIHYNIWYVNSIIFASLLIEALCTYSLYATDFKVFAFIFFWFQFWGIVRYISSFRKALFDSKVVPGLETLGQAQFMFLLLQCILFIIIHIFIRYPF